MKKLQFLIPHYNASFSLLKNLLDSIEMQRGIDFNDIEAIIVSDGSPNKLDSKDFETYSFSIKYFYEEENRGTSGIRNILLNKYSNAQYIMYCDQDDVFCDSIALNIIFNYIDNYHFDIFLAPFYEEVVINNKFFYKMIGLKDVDGIDSVFIHSKVYRRDFLIDNNIYWESSLRKANEDSFFNALAFNYAKNIRYWDKPFYIWVCNKDSVTRQTYLQGLNDYIDLINGNKLLIKEFARRSAFKLCGEYVAQLLINAYYNLNDYRIYPECLEKIHEYENILKDYYKEFNSYLDQLNQIDLANINETQRKINLRKVGNNFKFDIELQDWLKDIAGKNNA